MNSYTTDQEISRILNAFKMDAYAVLGLKPGAPTSDIRMLYRKKSLLIHPDKSKNPQAPDAFDRLKKAEAELMDEKKRALLDDAIADARKLVIKDRKITADHEDVNTDEFWFDVQEKTKHILIEEELRRRRARKLAMAQEGREKALAEAEADEARRKRDREKEWEESREKRISSWRDFKSGKHMPKKKKPKVLG